MNGKGTVVLNSYGGCPCMGVLRVGDTRRIGRMNFPKRFIRLVDTPACLVFLHKVWGETGYGARATKVLHRWPVKSVLRRTGVRK